MYILNHFQILKLEDHQLICLFLLLLTLKMNRSGSRDFKDLGKVKVTAQLSLLYFRKDINLLKPLTFNHRMNTLAT